MVNFFETMNENLKLLSHGFLGMENEIVTFEHVRDHWRTILHDQNPRQYPTGPVGISVAHLALDLFKTQTAVSYSQVTCMNCTYIERPLDDRLGYTVCADNTVTGSNSTTQWINNLSHEISRNCPHCGSAMRHTVFYKEVPPVLVLEYPFKNIATSHSLDFKTDAGIKTLKLRGIVYHGQYHFTSRIISNENQVWYHDGMVIGQSCINEGGLSNLCDEKLKNCRQRNLVLALYAQTL
jgi:hypothetical protein